MIYVGELADIPVGESGRVQGSVAIAVFNADGELYAIDDTCTHQDASLSDGWLEGCDDSDGESLGTKDGAPVSVGVRDGCPEGAALVDGELEGWDVGAVEVLGALEGCELGAPVDVGRALGWLEGCADVEGFPDGWLQRNRGEGIAVREKQEAPKRRENTCNMCT